MNELEKLRDELRAFSAERDWDQFHSPKNLASALAVESAELLEKNFSGSLRHRASIWHQKLLKALRKKSPTSVFKKGDSGESVCEQIDTLLW